MKIRKGYKYDLIVAKIDSLHFGANKLLDLKYEIRYENGLNINENLYIMCNSDNKIIITNNRPYIYTKDPNTDDIVDLRKYEFNINMFIHFIQRNVSDNVFNKGELFINKQSKNMYISNNTFNNIDDKYFKPSTINAINFFTSNKKRYNKKPNAFKFLKKYPGSDPKLELNKIYYVIDDINYGYLHYSTSPNSTVVNVLVKDAIKYPEYFEPIYEPTEPNIEYILDINGSKKILTIKRDHILYDFKKILICEINLLYLHITNSPKILGHDIVIDYINIGCHEKIKTSDIKNILDIHSKLYDK